VALAGAYGASGYRIDNADQLDQLPAALNHDTGMVVVDIRINGDYLDPVFRDITNYLESFSAASGDRRQG
jgi:thiamine pyrophosphate-dependent acetolactate synthase large subunit-like protein